MAKSFNELVERTTSEITRAKAARRAEELFSTTLAENDVPSESVSCDRPVKDEPTSRRRRWWGRLNPQLTSKETDQLIERGLDKASRISTIIFLAQITFFLWFLLPPAEFALWLAFLALLLLLLARNLPPLRGSREE